ncbi:DUF2946 family protein [Methylobacterium sp. A54F]
MTPLPAPRRLGLAALLLALWVQALAPSLAVRALARAADPLAGAVICGHAPDVASAEAPGPITDPAEVPSPAHAGCPACPVCAAGLASPLAPAAPDRQHPLRWRLAAWPVPPPAHPPVRPGRIPEPRGPPAPL